MMKHKYTVYFTGDEKEFKDSLRWNGDNYEVYQVSFGKSYWFIIKYRTLKWIADFAYWIGRKSDRLRAEN